jgi:C1A family cysteine protease
VSPSFIQACFKVLAAISLPVLRWIPFPCGSPRVQSLDLGTQSSWPQGVYDQGPVGDCVDNAVCLCLSHLESLEINQDLHLSRLFLYYGARGGVPQDIGSTIGQCAAVARTTGVCREATWPYDPTQVFTKPSEAAYREALQHVTGDDYLLLSLQAMLHCLDEGYPFAIGFTEYSSFKGQLSDAQGWVMPKPAFSDTRVGGHCVTVRGYDLEKQAFLCQNSWGAGWGLKDKPGCFWMPFNIACSPVLATGWRTFRKISNS